MPGLHVVQPCDVSDVLVSLGDGAYAFSGGACYQVFVPERAGATLYAGGTPTIVHEQYVGTQDVFVGEPAEAFCLGDPLYAVTFPDGIVVRTSQRETRFAGPLCLAVCQDRIGNGRIERRSPRPFVFSCR